MQLRAYSEETNAVKNDHVLSILSSTLVLLIRLSKRLLADELVANPRKDKEMIASARPPRPERDSTTRVPLALAGPRHPYPHHTRNPGNKVRSDDDRVVPFSSRGIVPGEQGLVTTPRGSILVVAQPDADEIKKATTPASARLVDAGALAAGGGRPSQNWQQPSQNSTPRKKTTPAGAAARRRVLDEIEAEAASREFNSRGESVRGGATRCRTPAHFAAPATPRLVVTPRQAPPRPISPSNRAVTPRGFARAELRAKNGDVRAAGEVRKVVAAPREAFLAAGHGLEEGAFLGEPQTRLSGAEQEEGRGEKLSPFARKLSGGGKVDYFSAPVVVQPSTAQPTTASSANASERRAEAEWSSSSSAEDDEIAKGERRESKPLLPNHRPGIHQLLSKILVDGRTPERRAPDGGATPSAPMPFATSGREKGTSSSTGFSPNQAPTSSNPSATAGGVPVINRNRHQVVLGIFNQPVDKLDPWTQYEEQWKSFSHQYGKNGSAFASPGRKDRDHKEIQRLSDIPFPPGHSVPTAQLLPRVTRSLARKDAYFLLLLRYHPDKFMGKWRISEQSQNGLLREKILEKVKQVCQRLNEEMQVK